MGATSFPPRAGGRRLLVEATTTVTTTIPRVENGRVVMSGGTALYEDATLCYVPAPPLPITVLRPEERVALASWPPDGLPIPTISPEEEGAPHFGALALRDHGGGEVVTTARDPEMQAAAFAMRSGPPFAHLLGACSGADVLHQLALMLDVARRSETDRAAALQRAVDQSSRYVGESFSFIGHTHFWPARLRGDAATWGVAEEFKLIEHTPEGAGTTRDLKAAWDSPAWREVLCRREHVRRAWGVVGLSWALLIDRLERGPRFACCKRCGRRIKGSAAKRFCGPEDDNSCFKARRAADRRRQLDRDTRRQASTE